MDTNNKNHITRWAQERLGLNNSNHPYTNWELLNACQIQVLSNTSYAQLKSEYVITNSTLKRYLATKRVYLDDALGVIYLVGFCALTEFMTNYSSYPNVLISMGNP